MAGHRETKSYDGVDGMRLRRDYNPLDLDEAIEALKQSIAFLESHVAHRDLEASRFKVQDLAADIRAISRALERSDL